MENPTPVPAAELEALREPAEVPLRLTHVWSAGSLEGLRRPVVAVVGTRAATAYGRGLARRFAGELTRAGCTVISGLALGIDAAAHEGALEANGVTIGVLGGGHRQFFPRRNRPLAQRMIEAGGAVLSPFEPDAYAYPSQFLQRNGVVAALSDAILVIEAPARSGALNTAQWAAGRIPVLAVPGDVDRRHVAGCHALIRDGAILARCTDDVLEVLRLAPLPLESPREQATRTPLESAILAALAQERSLDDLAAAVRAEPRDLLSALTLLELDGAVERRDGNRYACCSGR